MNGTEFGRLLRGIWEREKISVWSTGSGNLMKVISV
jgi:hypothetical protein